MFLCRLRSIATHRDHFVRRLSVRLSVCLSVRLSHSHSYVSQEELVPRDLNRATQTLQNTPNGKITYTTSIPYPKLFPLYVVDKILVWQQVTMAIVSKNKTPKGYNIMHTSTAFDSGMKPNMFEICCPRIERSGILVFFSVNLFLI